MATPKASRTAKVAAPKKRHRTTTTARKKSHHAPGPAVSASLPRIRPAIQWLPAFIVAIGVMTFAAVAYLLFTTPLLSTAQPSQMETEPDYVAAPTTTTDADYYTAGTGPAGTSFPGDASSVQQPLAPTVAGEIVEAEPDVPVPDGAVPLVY